VDAGGLPEEIAMGKHGPVEKRVLDQRHVRVLPGGFSWIDRRFVQDGWAERLDAAECALYFFLATVADKDGLSFYSDGRITSLIKLDRSTLVRARGRLLELGLVAWEQPLYQVLSVPDSVAEGRRRNGR
jgi:hypothetical protein